MRRALAGGRLAEPFAPTAPSQFSSTRPAITKPPGILSEILHENAQIDGTGRVEDANKAVMDPSAQLRLAKAQVARITWCFKQSGPSPTCPVPLICAHLDRKNDNMPSRDQKGHRNPRRTISKGRLTARVEPKPPCGKKRIANRANWNKPPSPVPNKRSREASPCRRASPGLLKDGRVFSSDKNDPLFCGFTLAYFFATWGNVDF